LDSRELLVLLESPLKDSTSPELVRGAIEAGLRWPTPTSYWAELAVRWLEEGAPMDEDLVKLLDELNNTRQSPQNLRHRAFALARRFEGSKDAR
jgi:hypothetical protein